MLAHRVGLSGFASPSVRAALAPQRMASQDLLAEYASRFDAVEMDSTFTRFPSRDTVSSWAEALPDGFAVSVRMPRTVTHVCGLDDARPLNEALAALAPLGTRLGCVLFTTPPAMGCDVAAVRVALDALPPGLASAWEFRHSSWLCPEVLDVLAAAGGAPVVADRTDDVAFGELVPGGALDGAVDLPFLYVRFRRDQYSLDELCDWGSTLQDALRAGTDVYCFFKQTPDAVAYALAMSEMLAEA